MRRFMSQMATGAVIFLAGAARGQMPPPPTSPPPSVVPPADTLAVAPETSGAPQQVEDPFVAYDAALYDQALQKFVDQQVERPEDPALMMNIGAAHYQMKSYEEAEKAFANAALRGDDPMRAKAFYNLGNVAFRQGKLEDAIARYQAALELKPEDEDAKFNLEFVRDEIRRRHEEAQKRQEQQQQQPQPQPGQQPQEEKSSQGPDADQDGLSDDREKTAENPTDPNNPDTDGDGLSDGQEDGNRNGRVDDGETDPNKKDTDGDGISDAEEAQRDQQRQPEPGAGAEPEEGMTPEQAERYLQGLEEGRPQKQRPANGQRRRPLKDW